LLLTVLRRASTYIALRRLSVSRRERHLKRLEHHLRATTVALYGVGPGAVEPLGIGDGASLEPCVFGGLRRADLFEAGVGDGLLAAAVVVLVPVVPDCWHDARNAMPIRTAVREIICFFIGYTLLRATECLWLS